MSIDRKGKGLAECAEQGGSEIDIGGTWEY